MRLPHFSAARCSTRLMSSSRSTTRKNDRPCPMATSESSATVSVHCGGTDHTVPSSALRSSRLPYRLYLAPTYWSRCPLRGWKGWITRTRCADPPGIAVLLRELLTPEIAFRPHFATSKEPTANRGGRRYLPYAFTEQSYSRNQACPNVFIAESAGCLLEVIPGPPEYAKALFPTGFSRRG